MKGFKNSWIVTENGKVRADLVFENGLIKNIENTTETDLIELPENLIIVPGFIDQHIHGAGGSDAMDGTFEDIKNISCALAKEGTTSYLATTMTQSDENINNALKVIKEYMDAQPEFGADVVGVHLEGPFISEKAIGAQPLEYVKAPSVEAFKVYEEASGNTIKLVTLAPEVEGSTELIKYLSSKGIIASIGHTVANYDEVEKAVKDGATNITHTYNAMKGLHHREAGTVGGALMFDELCAEIICDGIHVSAPAIKVLYKNKPHDKFVLITDSMRAKHMADGDYELGGQAVYVRNGEARLANGVLAGSVLKMNYAVRNVMRFLDLPIEEVVKYASFNPAKNLGIDHEVGSISVGKKANVVVVDENLEVYMTIKNGVVIYQKEN